MEEKLIGEITQKAQGVFQWQIKNFNEVWFDGRWYYSPFFFFGGGEWQLFIRRECKGRGRSERIELMLVRQRAAPSTLHVDYTFSVIDVYGHRCGEQRSRMELGDYNEGPWIPIYLEDKRMLVPNNRLKVLCHLKRIDPTQGAGLLPKTRLHQDLKQMLLNQEGCDVVIRVKEWEFRAHSFILKARSPVLASALRSDMREKATGIIYIEDLDPSAFSDFLHYLYCEEVDSLFAKNMYGLYTAADKYDVPDLRAKCVEFMKRTLSPETFCDIIRLALLHSETELIKMCCDFFIKNASKIVNTVEWRTFNAENPEIAAEIDAC